MAIGETLIIGVVSGVIASLTYTILMKMCKPQIKIVGVAIQNDERKLFIVKVINRTRCRLTDVECNMQYYKALSNGYIVFAFSIPSSM